MINIVKKDGKLIGIYQEFFSDELLMVEKDLKNYIYNRLIEELKIEDTSGLFTYEIIESAKEVSKDLFGVSYAIIFEFVPNKELVAELNLVAERLEVGL